MATQDNKDDIITEEYEALGWADADKKAVEDTAREAEGKGLQEQIDELIAIAEVLNGE